jgi:hypothetical protein
MMMSEPSRQTGLRQMELELMLSVAGSLVRISALPAGESGLVESAVDCGSSSTGSLPKSARKSPSSKTSQPFALEDWTKCSGASLRSGMMRNGIVYPLPPLVHHTGGIASGLWPTPTSRDWKSSSMGHQGNARPLSEHMTGPLNPTWVEWLMGFPLGWTALNALETPSSRKSRKSSVAR